MQGNFRHRSARLILRAIDGRSVRSASTSSAEPPLCTAEKSKIQITRCLTLDAMSIWRKKRQKEAHMRRENWRLHAPRSCSRATMEKSSDHASVERSYITCRVLFF